MPRAFTSNTVYFHHDDCEYFEPINNDDNSPANHGNCAALAEHLRMFLGTTAERVVVDGDEFAAEVWLDAAGSQESICRGCPHFLVTEAALDAIAEQLQTPTERFGLNAAGE